MERLKGALVGSNMIVIMVARRVTEEIFPITESMMRKMKNWP
jgi:hypothetical protein